MARDRKTSREMGREGMGWGLEQVETRLSVSLCSLDGFTVLCLVMMRWVERKVDSGGGSVWWWGWEWG